MLVSIQAAIARCSANSFSIWLILINQNDNHAGTLTYFGNFYMSCAILLQNSNALKWLSNVNQTYE